MKTVTVQLTETEATQVLKANVPTRIITKILIALKTAPVVTRKRLVVKDAVAKD